MRALLRMTLAACADLELAGEAVDGMAGLEAVERLKPDLVLLDIEMPRMDGLEALEQIRARRFPVKVVMCSTLTRRGAGITLEALARGAEDYVAKPSTQCGAREGIEALRGELLPKIRALFASHAGYSGIARRPLWSPPPGMRTAATGTAAGTGGVLVVGSSTGGPAALDRFLPALPADFPLPVLIAQHMPSIFTALLAERLNGLCGFAVREALGGETVERGTAYVARGDRHMQAVGSAAHCALHLAQTAPEEHCRPSVDVLFRSAAMVYGAATLAVVLTGMGSDGLEGCQAIHSTGGRVLVQDRETSAVWGMPGSVARAGLADGILPLNELAAEVARFAARRAAKSA